MVMLLSGVIVLVAAFAPSSANAVIPNSALVPTGPAAFSVSCTGADDTTNAVLTGVGLNPLVLPATMTTNAIDSPSDGEAFTLEVTTNFVLPASIVAIAQSTGNTVLTQTNSTLTIGATSGATGANVTLSDPGPTAINLPPASDPAVDVPFQTAPGTVTFTRSGTGPVVLTPLTTTATSTAGAIPLNLTCTASGGALTLNDQEGPTPPPTTAAPVWTLPPAPTTTAAPAGPVVAATGTSQSSTLARTGFHAELLFLGIGLLGAGYALSMTGRRVARASARSR